MRAPGQVVTSINNLIIGRIYVDHGGVMRVRNAATGLVAKLRFREHSFLRSHNEHEARARTLAPRSQPVCVAKRPRNQIQADAAGFAACVHAFPPVKAIGST